VQGGGGVPRRRERDARVGEEVKALELGERAVERVARVGHDLEQRVASTLLSLVLSAPSALLLDLDVEP